MRRITPAFFECMSRIDMAIPPGMMGNPTVIGGSRLCGHRFQIGGAPRAAACALCGRDSVGTCEGECDRRLCGMHGAANGAFRCADCIAAEKQRQIDSYRVMAAGVKDRLRAAIGGDDGRVLAEALLDVGPTASKYDILEDDEFAQAWRRYVDLCSPAPDWEFVSFRRGGRWRDPVLGLEREPIWEWIVRMPGPTDGGTEPVYWRTSSSAIDRHGRCCDWAGGSALASSAGCAVRPGESIEFERKGTPGRHARARPAPEGLREDRARAISPSVVIALVKRLEGKAGARPG